MRGGRDREGVRAWVRIATRADWGRVGSFAFGRHKILNDVVAKPECFIHRLVRCFFVCAQLRTFRSYVDNLFVAARSCVHSFAHLDNLFGDRRQFE